MSSPKVGNLIKVHMPGETPWAIVEEVVAPDVLRARIENGPHCGETKPFRRVDIGAYWNWQVIYVPHDAGSGA